MPIKFEVIRENFQALRAAARGNDPTILVSDAWGKRLYTTAMWRGRLWRWYYHLIALLGSWFHNNEWQEASSKNIIRAIWKTDRLFRFFQREMEKYQRRLEAEVADTAEGPPMQPEKIIEQATEIMKLVRTWETSEREKIEIFCKNYLKQAGDQKPFTLARCEIGSMKNILTIAKMQKQFDKKVPLRLLYVLSIGRELRPGGEDRELREWIKKANDLLTLTALKDFLRALSYLTFRENKEKQFLLVCCELRKRGCTLFDQREETFLSWRETLTPGTPFKINDTTYTLGGRVEEKRKEVIFFRVREREDVLLCSPQNSLILRMRMEKQERAEEEASEIRLMEVDAKTGCAIVQRWGRKPNVEEMGAFLKKLISKNQTPQPFRPDDFRIMGDEVKSIVGLKYDPFKFEVFEQFVFDWANGDPGVYKTLCAASGLDTRMEVAFFNDIVEAAIGEKNIDLNQIASNQKVRPLPSNGWLFRDAVHSLGQQCSVAIKAQYKVLNPQKLFADHVKPKIIALYREKKGIGRLWPGFKEEVIQGVASSMQLQSRAVQ